MLYWTRLLVIAYSTTKSVEAFIPFYLYDKLKLNTMSISIFVASIYLLRSISAVWSITANSRTHLYGKIITLLTVLSSISFIIILTLENQSYVVLAICCLLDGLFYQPLDILIHTVIIKVLGDYRTIFYGSFLRWKDITGVVMIGITGLVIHFTNEDNIRLILLILWIIGMISLSIISNTNQVKPSSPAELNISEDQAPLLLKNALSLTTDQNSIYFPIYKPYSIFGEQLSHISEEDASQLDRMLTNDSLRHVSSFDSNAPSFYTRRTMTNTYTNHNSNYDDNYIEQDMTVTTHAYALALLPLPTTTDPLVALLSKQEDEELYDDLFIPRNYILPINHQLIKLKNWKLKTLGMSILLLGITDALLNTFLFMYAYSVLGISLSMISWLIVTNITSQSIVHCVIEKWFIHKLNLTLTTTLVHICLIICTIVYPCLKPNNPITNASLFVLQAVQAASFQLIWSSAIDQIQFTVWNQYERMKERSKASVLFSSIGPAIGAIVAGIVLQSSLEEYSFLLKIAVVVLALSFVTTWGWTTDE
ncbi:unnamed protein product [Rhizopus microsporus]|nr:hypothetical protein RMCBS344292_12941 [Rhizopus microsporus]